MSINSDKQPHLDYETTCYYISYYGLKDIVNDKFYFFRKTGFKWNYTGMVECKKCHIICYISPPPRKCECGGEWGNIWKKEYKYELESAPIRLLLMFHDWALNGGIIPSFKNGGGK